SLVAYRTSFTTLYAQSGRWLGIFGHRTFISREDQTRTCGRRLPRSLLLTPSPVARLSDRGFGPHEWLLIDMRPDDMKFAADSSFNYSVLPFERALPHQKVQYPGGN